MAGSREDIIRLLEMELDYIEGGGYGSPAGKPTEEKPIFYHSPACINHWEVPEHPPECHDDCVLLDAVPKPHRNESLPCHFIPLNSAGETIQSLQEKDDRDSAQEAVKEWLRETIRRLKSSDTALDAPDVKY